jgi:cephalosporin-C deacetylase-like acetyl esterase
MTGPVVGREPGWPKWYWKTEGKDEAKVRRASQYYDVVNFASRIKCPVLVGVGLLDQTCPCAGVYAALNAMTSPKEVVLLPRGEHQDRHGSHAPYYARFGAWLAALRQHLHEGPPHDL